MDDLAIDTSAIGPYTKTRSHSIDTSIKDTHYASNYIDALISQTYSRVHDIDSYTEISVATYTTDHDVDTFLQQTGQAVSSIDSFLHRTESRPAPAMVCCG